MSGSPEATVADVVARFFDSRRSGQRVSIDQVLESVGGVSDRAGTRAAALRTIAMRVRSESQDGASSEPDEAAAAIPPVELPELDGYDIIDDIGRGGMGIVYEAYQQSTGRRVAIKFMLESAAATEAARRRFEREVELVARLDHPHIVSVLDSGVHRGRYFYVMDYVDGRPLDAALAPGTCDVRQTLGLMQTVCDAVDYAHQRGVLHRDLKPSNILLDERGQPRLLDFGLAKAIDPQSSSGVELTLSEPGQLLGTLAYMSPEQSRGEFAQMSVRSDVYSLGALTYELLTAELPCDTDGPLGDVLERIARHDPARPSRLRHKLSADVDAILLKALNKAPPDRYATAGELAADVRRYLKNETITARRAGLATRAVRWTRRNRGVAGVAALGLVLIVAVTGTSFVQIMAERDKARTEAKKAEQTNEFLQEMLASVDPGEKGRDVTVREVLDDAAEKIETSLQDQPEVQAAIHTTIGLTYVGLGLYDLAEPHFRAALTTRKTLFGDENLDVATSLANLAGCLLQQGEYAAAEPLYREALETKRELLGDDHPEVAARLNDLGVLLRATGKSAEAEPLYREALAIQQEHLGTEDVDVAGTMSDLAQLLKDAGDYDEAEQLHREALAIRRRLLDPVHPDVAMSLNNLALLLHTKRDYEATEPLYRQTLEMARELWGTHMYVAMTLNNLGGLLWEKGDPASAEPLFREALEMARELLGPEHPFVATSLNNLGGFLQRTGKPREAEPLLREALAIRRSRLGNEHPNVADSLLLLGRLLDERGAHEAAEPLLRECVEIRRQSSPETDAATAETQTFLGGCLTELGRFEEAEALLLESYPIVKADRGETHRDTLAALQRIIHLYEAWGKPDEAARYRAMLPPEAAPPDVPADTPEPPSGGNEADR